MPKLNTFTPAQDRTLFQAIQTIPAATLAAAIFFLLIKDRPDRAVIVQRVKAASGN